MNILKKLKKELEQIFDDVANDLSDDRTITDRTLDDKILSIVLTKSVRKRDIEIYFSQPSDDIYNAEARRTPYDILIYGKIKKVPFKVFLNNKWGVIKSNARNDTTTYNNILRLYLNIKTQRLTKKIEIDKSVILKRISGEELISYAIFIIDKNTRDHKFFFFEEIEEKFYINPRNTMFQIRYNPDLRYEPMDFYTFILSFIDASLLSLNKSVNRAKTEIIVLNQLKTLVIKAGKNVKE